MRAVVLVLTLTGCAASGAARYAHAPAPPLPAAAQPLDPEGVVLAFAPFTWQATAGTDHEFRVILSAEGGNPPRTDGAVVGDLRTRDRRFGARERRALYCGWGTGRYDECEPAEPDARARALVLGALDDLRAEAARVGATEVRDVRCFVRARGFGGRLWCEGLGTTAVLDASALPSTGLPAPTVVARPVAARSRWRLGATASGGRYGDRAVVGTTLDVSYRGLKTAFHMVSPPDQRSAALGLEVLYRHALDDRFAALGGVAAMLLAPLSADGTADNTRTRGALGPVLGLGVEAQAFSLFEGFGKPFAEVRAGWLFAPPAAAGDEDLAGPSVELLVGLVTP